MAARRVAATAATASPPSNYLRTSLTDNVLKYLENVESNQNCFKVVLSILLRFIHKACSITGQSNTLRLIQQNEGQSFLYDYC